jgi:hypothetical protein
MSSHVMGQPHDGIANDCGGSTTVVTEAFKTPLLRKSLCSDVLADFSTANKLKKRDKVPFM